MEVKFLKGNIVDSKVDAIVLPANTELKEGTGSSEAIFKAAGRRELTKACKKIGFCEVGSAVPTLGYNLNAKYIIHAVVPKWLDGDHEEYELLSATYATALELAEVMECKSIAFPLLASGNNGFDLELALEIALKTIESYDAKNLEIVTIILFKNDIADLVKKLGFEVKLLPRNLEEDLKKKEQAIMKKKIVDGVKDGAKDVVQQILNEQLEKGINMLKDPKKRKAIIAKGCNVVKWIKMIKK